MFRRVLKTTALVGVGYFVGQLVYAYNLFTNSDEWIVRLRQFRDERDRREQLAQAYQGRADELDAEELFDGTSDFDVAELIERDDEDDTDYGVTDD
jgi:hypothetical protein